MRAKEFRARVEPLRHEGSVPYVRTETEEHNSRPAPADAYREFKMLVGEVYGSTAYTQTSYVLNPGLDSTFPLLAAAASLFQFYDFIDLEFYYEPSINSYNSQGVLCLSANADGILAPAPQTIEDQLNNTISVSAMPHCHQSFEVSDVLRKRSAYFVRGDAQRAGADPRFSDLGILTVGVEGMAAAMVGALVGRIHVRGLVKLMDALQEPNTFVLPYYLSQVFVTKASKTANISTNLLLGSTAPALTDYVCNDAAQLSPYAEYPYCDLSGWELSSGNLICPATAMYDITIDLLMYVNTPAANDIDMSVVYVKLFLGAEVIPLKTVAHSGGYAEKAAGSIGCVHAWTNIRIPVTASTLLSLNAFLNNFGSVNYIVQGVVSIKTI